MIKQTKRNIKITHRHKYKSKKIKQGRKYICNKNKTKTKYVSKKIKQSGGSSPNNKRAMTDVSDHIHIDDYETDTDDDFNVIVAEPRQYIITNMEKQIYKKALFKIEHEDCIRHFLVKNRYANFKLAYLTTKYNEGVIVKRDDSIDEPLLLNVLAYIKTNKIVYEDSFLKQHGVYHLNFRPEYCEKEINLTDANLKILELNNLLNVKCNNLRLSLSYIYNSTGDITLFEIDKANYLLLCLNNSYGCISSISLDVENTFNDLDAQEEELKMTFTSKTKTEFEGKKYNKLLRAVAILISPLLKIRYIESYAVNAISSYLLITHFNAVADEEFLRFSNSVNGDTTSLLDLIKEYDKPIELKIDTYDAVTIQKAQAVFNELLSEPVDKHIICN